MAKQKDEGSFDEMNMHQPVTAFNKQDLLKGIPANPKTFKALDSPTTIISTAQGFACLNSFARIAGMENLRRYGRNFTSAKKILDQDLPKALFSSSPELGKSLFAPFDLIFSITDTGPENPEAPVDLTAQVTRFLIEQQEKDGTWNTKHKPTHMVTSSFRERLEALPEIKGANFDYTQANVPSKQHFRTHYYAYAPKLVPTAYALIALSDAKESAPIPEDIKADAEKAIAVPEKEAVAPEGKKVDSPPQ
jgi:hypothetical protein